MKLDKAHLEAVRQIVARHVDTEIWQPVIFGSRANGQARRFSDIDLGFIGSRPLPAAIRAKLWDAFDESDIPYVVDIVDLGTTQADFHAVAEQDMVRL